MANRTKTRLKKLRSSLQKLVNTISGLLKQPLSDESYEVQSKKSVRRSKRVAAGPRRTKKRRSKK